MVALRISVKLMTERTMAAANNNQSKSRQKRPDLRELTIRYYRCLGFGAENGSFIATVGGVPVNVPIFFL